MTGVSEATSGVAIEAVPETLGLGLAANTGSTILGCAGDFFNEDTFAGFGRACGSEVTLQVVSEGHVGGGVYSEIARWYGDVNTAVWDLHNLPY